MKDDTIRTATFTYTYSKSAYWASKQGNIYSKGQKEGSKSLIKENSNCSEFKIKNRVTCSVVETFTYGKKQKYIFLCKPTLQWILDKKSQKEQVNNIRKECGS